MQSTTVECLTPEKQQAIQETITSVLERVITDRDMSFIKERAFEFTDSDTAQRIQLQIIATRDEDEFLEDGQVEELILCSRKEQLKKQAHGR